MKRVLIILTILFISAVSVTAQSPNEPGVISFKFRVSGSVTMLGNPFEAPFSTIVHSAGKGPLGKITGQGFWTYQTIGTDGVMICGGGQLVIRLDSTGDTLLLTTPPGPTGSLVFTGPETMAWEQTLNASIAGGTGVFDGAEGNAKMSITGLGATPGFVNSWEGMLRVNIRKN